MNRRYIIRKKKLYEDVIEQLIRLVETQNYRVGDRLPSLQELSAMFRVGKPTVREALCVLASTGSLEIVHGNGVFIRRLPLKPCEQMPVPLEDIDNEQLLYWLELRRAIEVEAAALAAERREEADLRSIEEAQLRLETALQDGNSQTIADWDYQFHYRIVLATHNPIFIQAAENIAQTLQAYFEPTSRQSLALPWRKELMAKEHRQIWEEIKNRRPREARRTMLEHITNVERKVLLLDKETDSP
ncbi:MAG: FadR/GntR family transcriptional regulator [Moorellaceae bacterium]